MKAPHLLTATALISLIVACGGGGGGDSTTNPVPPPAPPPARAYANPAQENLLIFDVETILAQAIQEAQAQGTPATIAVVDRVGNVLAVFSMNGVSRDEFVRRGPSRIPADDEALQGVAVPRATAAIAKAITGAYLSSAGNAFSSRTASMIVQEHFPPAPTTIGLESGPLFGVQFSQLPCSDLSTRYVPGPGGTIGPKRSPLGLSADPGGFPLYKNGVVVGGIGVSADDDYGFDTNVLDVDDDVEEHIALAGSVGFEAPTDIRANRINVDGTQLRFSDATTSSLKSDPAAAPAYFTLEGSAGMLVRVRGYYSEMGMLPSIEEGEAYGDEDSGIRQSTTAEYSNRDVFVLTDGAGANRYAPRNATDGASVAQPLTAAEVQTIIDEAFKVMTAARAQIRQPVNSRAQVSISVVDTNGAILGIVRSPDAPIFGTDVSLQKARTASFFSGSYAAADLSAANPASRVPAYVGLVRSFLNDPTALTGTFAFADRSGGNLSRPYFPDGEVGTPNGPLSRPISKWSPFNVGLQSDLVTPDIGGHIGFITGLNAMDVPRRCTSLPNVPGTGAARLQNGIQIFPGSVPIYRGNVLVGGIGVSGDGIDQDDMISFLGVHNAGLVLGTLGNAPANIRADQITVPVNGNDIRLRYINCPFTPFLGSNDNNVCQGK